MEQSKSELIKEITALKRRISELESNAGLQQKYQLLKELATDPSLYSLSLSKALSRITGIASGGMGTGRTSIWYYHDQGRAIRCMDLFEKELDRHSSGIILGSEDYPAYFDALKTDRVIAAEDARTDHRTSEFTENYLKPLGIGAMLDAPIMAFGKTYGVLCFEHIGQARSWNSEEMSFATSIADIVALVIETNERREAEALLEQETELLRTLIDNLPDHVYFKDRKSRFILNNKAQREFMGADSFDEVVGLCDHDFFPSEIADKSLADEHMVLREGKKILNREETNIGADGRKLWLHTSKIPVYNRKGKVVSMVGISRDITTQKETEIEKDRVLAELKRSNEDLEQFAYAVSHDLQEPLRKVKSFVELFTSRYRGNLDEKADQFIHYIVDGTERMQKLIQDLLLFSRVSTRGKELSPIDLKVPLESAAANLQLEIEDKQVSLDTGDLPEVYADESQMTQLFQNLIGNAIKFRGDRKPRIEIQCTENDDDWLVSVKDNGIGINPDAYDRIFQVFQRLHSKDEYPGTGIGLALCRRILERHQGRIWVQSEPGIGSVFSFTLPRQPVKI